MRQFKLWNSKRTEAFDFTSSGCLITDVADLGIRFQTTIANSVVVDYKKEFEDITLKVNFGINTNPYTIFSTFASFVASNGRNPFVLEYSVNQKTLYTDVWMKQIPKSQKTSFNILTETLVFTRISYWYTIVSGNLTTTSITINNSVMDDIAVNIIIQGVTSSNFKVVLSKTSTILSEIKLINELSLTQTLIINSEQKTVVLEDSGISSNGYNLINRLTDTFIIVPSGSYTLSTVGTAGLSTFSYKKWVID